MTDLRRNHNFTPRDASLKGNVGLNGFAVGRAWARGVQVEDIVGVAHGRRQAQ